MAEVIIHNKYNSTQQELYGIADSMITSLMAVNARLKLTIE